MAILEEPAAKRRRLDVPEVEHNHVDLDALIHDLVAVSPWEIITAGIPLYQRLHVATPDLLLPVSPTQTTQRLYNMLVQHLEICLEWTATDTDECDDQELYVQAVTCIVTCLQDIYSPELDQKDENANENDDDDDDNTSSNSISLLFRTLCFLLQHEDDPSSNSVEGILQMVRFQLTSTAAVWDTLSTIQQLDGIILLVRVSSKTALSILTWLQRHSDFAVIALDTIHPKDNAARYPQPRTETLFGWVCQMAYAGTRSKSLPGNIAAMLNTLRNVILETQQQLNHCSSLDRTLALDCMVSLSQQPLSDNNDACLSFRRLVLDLLSNPQQRLVTASCAVMALQNLLVDDDENDETLFEYFDAMDDPPTFLSVLLQVSHSCRQQTHLVEERFLQTANHFQNVSVWALELFWTFVSVVVRRLDIKTAMEAVVELALSAIDDCCRNDEYKLYLASRTICRDHSTIFQMYSTHSTLVGALSIILHDAHSSAVSKDAVITFFQTIVQDSDDVSFLISQDRDVLDAIAQLGATGENDEASKLLFALADYVPNRMRLVRRPRVLLAMMRYAQQQLQHDDKGRYYQRRIGQLAELL